MRRLPFILVLICFGLVHCAHAGLAWKGPRRGLDELLSEGFEDESWRIAWTLVDADGSGTSWQSLGEDQYYDARGGSHSLGCRFNSDGSPNDDWLISPPMSPDSAHRSFSIWYRSQDPDHPETVEFLTLHVDQALSPEDLQGRVGDFQRQARVLEAPIEWQSFTYEVDYPDLDGVWYFAVRCVSTDRFVLLVDDAAGFSTQAIGDWVIESRYQRMDFGLLRQDSLATRPFRLWNLHADSLLEAVISHRPQAPFVMASTWVEGETVSAAGEDSLGVLVGAKSLFAVDGDTTRYRGTFADSLVLDLFHHNSGLFQLVIPFTVSVWHPDSLDGALHADFETDSLRGGWLAGLGPEATDPLSWELQDFVSSANFTVPATTRFAVVNSDARGRFTADGLPLVQDAWLWSPWLDARQSPGGDVANGLLLAWSQVYDERAGGLLEVVAQSGADTMRWEPEPSAEWANRSLDLSQFAGRDSVRVAFRFRGSWSYGAAVDDVLVLPVATALPGVEGVPEPAPLPLGELTVAPNPFNPITVLSYQAPAAARLDIRVYNLLGQEVMRSGPWLAREGANPVALDFSAQASGVYLVQALVVDGQGREGREVRRVTLVK